MYEFFILNRNEFNSYIKDLLSSNKINFLLEIGESYKYIYFANSMYVEGEKRMWFIHIRVYFICKQTFRTPL
uniref:Uncharacterized protein n=1 Tax=Lepeophtheirus salmonis TaxID=72036 RepID=A0A0K2U8Q8_LEPSM